MLTLAATLFTAPIRSAKLSGEAALAATYLSVAAFVFLGAIATDGFKSVSFLTYKKKSLEKDIALLITELKAIRDLEHSKKHNTLLNELKETEDKLEQCIQELEAAKLKQQLKAESEALSLKSQYKIKISP